MVSPPPFPGPLPPPHVRLGVGGVLLRNGCVVVNRASYRQRFTIPSGYVEAGETLATALAREFEEETGATVEVGRLLLARHKVVRSDESDVFFAFALRLTSGEPAARPPEIVEVRTVPVAEAIEAPWISELSRLAIRVAVESPGPWPRSAGPGSEAPGLGSEAFHPDLTAGADR